MPTNAPAALPTIDARPPDLLAEVFFLPAVVERLPDLAVVDLLVLVDEPPVDAFDLLFDAVVVVAIKLSSRVYCLMI